jgi:hypothetical protein
MNGVAWEALLRHVPKQVYEKLMVVTSSGTEITIQNILRIDREFFAFKGRLAGTQNAGRLFFLPYGAIDYFGFQETVKDKEYEEWFGSLALPEGDERQEEEAAAAGSASTAEAAPQPAATPEAAAPASPSGNSETVNPVVKSAVLEKFRARSQSGSGVRPRVVPPAQPK